MSYSNEDNGDDDDDREQDEGTKRNWVTRHSRRSKDRFNHLFIQFTREKQYEHGHELTVLLGEMLYRGLVTPIEYNNLNSLIVIPDKSSYEEEEEEEGEMRRVIKDAVDQVIQHDKERTIWFSFATKLVLDALLDLELLAGKFLIDEFQAIVTNDRRTESKVRSISGVIIEILRVKMLLIDINNNRIDDAADNEEDIWNC